ncbi:aquaporin-like protein [Polychaeton citri CBS 116435]|uniref:Aquaporin-like protein n=1 Tax=Polychaeton citri CBS 116435 TaxID=1314669 RepID=A0A9P4QC08_9PEZI|nr:aquaporin-like protein [Polychaeton citri CBS 116435]
MEESEVNRSRTRSDADRAGRSQSRAPADGPRSPIGNGRSSVEGTLELPPAQITATTSSQNAVFPDLRRRSTVASRASRRSKLAPRPSNISRRDQFTLAGPEDTQQLRATHEPFVHPGYTDLNPSYEQAQNVKPVWSLAKPLPRVVRPGMVPTKDELLQIRQNAELPAENSQKLGLDVDLNDLEKGRIQPTANPAKLSAQIKDTRTQRENNFISSLQSGGVPNRVPSRVDSSRYSTTSQRRRRASTWDGGRDAIPPVWEEHEGEEAVAFNARRPEYLDASQVGKPPDALRPVPEAQESPEEDKGYDTASVTTFSPDEADLPDDLHPLVQEMVEDEIHNNHTSWSVVRTHYREGLAELLAVVLQLTMGFSSDISVTVGKAGDPNTTAWAWGFATMIGIYISGGISGAHLNPVITAVLWFYRGFPKSKMPEYFIAQFLGAFIAAFVAYGLYYASIQHYLITDPTSVSNIVNSFVTSQRYTYIDAATAFFSEFVGTAVLSCTILALGDNQNAPPGAGMNSLIIGLVITTLNMCFVFQTGAALNPSRDFGPRLALLALGYGSELFTNPYWFYGPFAGALCGGFIGAFLYDLAIFTGGESPINYPWTRTKRAAFKSKQKWKKRLHIANKSQ